MEYWSGGDLEQALGGEPLLTFPNPSHDRADRRGAAAGLVSGRLPGRRSNRVDTPFLQATRHEHDSHPSPL